MNPSPAGLPASPEEWRWSSAQARLSGQADELVDAGALLEMVHASWRDYLGLPTLASDVEKMRKHEDAGRPLGSNDFITGLEASLGGRLRPQKGGGPRKER